MDAMEEELSAPSCTLKRQKLKQKQAIHIVLQLVVCIMVCDDNFNTAINLFQDGDCQHDPSQGIAGVGDYTDITPGSEDDLLDAVANVGPISVALDCKHRSFQVYYSIKRKIMEISHLFYIFSCINLVSILMKIAPLLTWVTLYWLLGMV